MRKQGFGSKSKRMLAILLAASMMIPQNTTVLFAEEVQTEADAAAAAAEQKAAEEAAQKAAAEEAARQAAAEEAARVAEAQKAAEEAAKKAAEEEAKKAAEEAQHAEISAPEAVPASDSKESETTVPASESTPSQATETEDAKEPEQHPAEETTEAHTDTAEPQSEEASSEKESESETETETETEEAIGTRFVYEDRDIEIVAIASEAANLPADAQLHADYLEKDSKAYQDAVAAIEAQLSEKLSDHAEDMEDIVFDYVLYDIYFTSESRDGRIDPEEGKVKVTLRFKEPTAEKDVVEEALRAEDPEEVSVEESVLINTEMVHVKDNGKAEIVTDRVHTDSEGAVTSVEFSQDTFSPSGLVFAVRKARATDVNTDEIGHITQVELKQNQPFESGTQLDVPSGDIPTDAAGEYHARGKDFSNTDHWVRSNDSIKYYVETSYQLNGDVTEDTRVRIGMEVTIPKDPELYLDKGAMSGWMQDLKETVNDDNTVTYTFYRTLPKEDVHTAGSSTQNVILHVGNKTEGYQITPQIKAWVEGNDTTLEAEDIPTITVTTVPMFNLVLSNANGMSEKSAFEIGEGETKETVVGYLAKFGIAVEMRNEDRNAGMRGLEYPDPNVPITFDVDISALKRVDGSDEKTDVTADFTPVVYMIKENGENNDWTPGIPYGNIGDRNHSESCEKSGNVSYTTEVVTGEDGKAKTVIHFSVTGFDCTQNTIYPEKGLGGGPQYKVSEQYLEQVFSSWYIGVIFPHNAKDGSRDIMGDDTKCTIYLDAVDRKMSVTSIVDGSQATAQTFGEDDTKQVDKELEKGNGKYDHQIFFSRTNDDSGWTDGFADGDKNSGTDTATLGATAGFSGIVNEKVEFDDIPHHAVAMDQLVKFDDQAISVDPATAGTLFNGKATRNDEGDDWTFRQLFAYKADGTGWTSEAELLSAKEEDLVYSEGYDGSRTCVGVLYQWRGCNTNTKDGDISREAQTAFQVKVDPEIIDKSFILTATTNVWQAEQIAALMLDAGYKGTSEDEAGTSLSFTQAQYREFAQNSLTDAMLKEITPADNVDRDNNYRKATYINGVYQGGSSGFNDGDTIYIIPYRTTLIKRVSQTDSEGAMKVVYDLSNNQRIADFEIVPHIDLDARAGISSDAWTTEVTVHDYLPQHLTYREGSAVIGGIYEPVGNDQTAIVSGSVAGAVPMEPTISNGWYYCPDCGHTGVGEKPSDFCTVCGNGRVQQYDTQVLTWTIPGVVVKDGDLTDYIIHYSCNIGNPRNVKQDVKDSAVLTNYADICTDQEHRVIKSNNANVTHVDITASKLSSFNIYKGSDPVHIEADGTSQFDLAVNNSGNLEEKDICAVDLMPFHGKSYSKSLKPTIKNGIYQITSVTIDPELIEDLSDVSIYYTFSENVADHELEEFTKDVILNGTYDIEWTRASLDEAGNITGELIGAWPTAIAYLDDSLKANCSSFITVSFKADRAASGDYLANTYGIAAKKISADAAVDVYTRSIEGIAWKESDSNGNNGTFETGDTVWKDIPVTLYLIHEDGTKEKVAEATTDKNGHYFFGVKAAAEGKDPVIPEADDVLHAGTYAVEFGVPAGYGVTTNEKATQNDIAGNASTKDASLADGDGKILNIELPTIAQMRTFETTDPETGAVISVGMTHYHLPEQNAGFYTVKPHKKETAPAEAIEEPETETDGNGKTTIHYGAVKVGEELTYEISYTNYKGYPTTVTVVDTLDRNVEYVSASPADKVKVSGGVVTWTLPNVPAGETGSVTLTVQVKPGAKNTNLVANTASVKVDNDTAQITETVDNPVPEEPTKKSDPVNEEVVKVGERITYTISYKNYRKNEADVVITDVLDDGVDFVAASDKGAVEEITQEDGTTKKVVTWTIAKVAPGKSDSVTLTVRVNANAPKEEDGEQIGHVKNKASVKVGNDASYETNELIHPVPETPVKTETTPGADESVKPGDPISYVIDYKNFEDQTAEVITITDVLDPNLVYVSAGFDAANTPENTAHSVSYDKGTNTVTWTIEGVATGAAGKVTLNVTVSETLDQNKVHYVENVATVDVDNHPIQTNYVDNPIPPVKTEIKPGEGKGVKPGDELTYQVSWINYDHNSKTVTVTDELDDKVEFVSASEPGVCTKVTKDGAEKSVVTWIFGSEDTPLAFGAHGDVTLTVRVKEDAEKGTVVENTAAMTVENHTAQSNTVRNPIPEDPVKEEITPGRPDEESTYGKVDIGDEITYTVTAKNYKDAAADLKITDILDSNVTFKEFVDFDAEETGGAAKNTAEHKDGVLTWILKAVPAGEERTVTFTVTVNDGALRADEVTNKASVQVGNDQSFETNEISNPLDLSFARSLEGTVWFDGDRNGTRTESGSREDGTRTIAAPDTFLAGIAVKLIPCDKDGNVLTGEEAEERIQETTTDAYGHYRFTGLDEGYYRIEIANDAFVTKKAAKEDGTNSIASNEMAGDKKIAVITTQVKLPSDEEMRASGVQTYHLPNQDAGFIAFTPEKTETKDTLDKDGKTPAEVSVGDIITYEISFMNTHADAANITITDELDANVAFVEALDQDGKSLIKAEEVPAGSETAAEGVSEESGSKGDTEAAHDVAARKDLTGTVGANTAAYAANDHKVTWTLKNVAAYAGGKVTLKVKVLEAAVKPAAGKTKGEVSNTASVAVGNDSAVDTDKITNPVDSPVKRSISGIAWNDTDVSQADAYGTRNGADAPRVGVTVSLYKYNEETKQYEKVTKNEAGDDLTSVKTGTDGSYEFTDLPEGKYIVVFEDEAITTKQSEESDGTKSIVDTIDPSTIPGVNGKFAGTPVIELPSDAAIKQTGKTSYEKEHQDAGFVAFTRSLSGIAWEDENRDGRRDDEEAPVAGKTVTLIDLATGKTARDASGKECITTTGEDGSYEFTNLNPGSYKVVIDYDKYVTEKEAEDAEEGRNSKAVNDPSERGAENVALTAVITTSELPSDAAIKAAIDKAFEEAAKAGTEAKLPIDKDNNIHSPNWDAGFIEFSPVKREGDPDDETAPVEGDIVTVGETLTYEVLYYNTHSEAATITVTDTLYAGLDYVEGSASDGGIYDAATRTITWTIANVQPYIGASVSFKATVNETAKQNAIATGAQIENTAGVHVGTDAAVNTNTVKNPVETSYVRSLEGVAWFDDNHDGVRSDSDLLLAKVPVKLQKKNDKGAYVDVLIEGKTVSTMTDEKGHYSFTGLDAGDYRVIFDREQYVTKKSLKADGKNSIADNLFDKDGVANAAVISEITLPTDLEIKQMAAGAPTGEGALGKDDLFHYNLPNRDAGFVSFDPVKTEVTPGEDKQVSVNDVVTYEISYCNYHAEAATVTITDALDEGVSFVSAEGGTYDEATHTVIWTLKDVPAWKEGKVTLKVKVEKDAVKDDQQIENGAIVQVGNDAVSYTNIVTNPVNPKLPDDSGSTTGKNGNKEGGKESGKGGARGGSNPPKTGDDTPIATYLILLLAAVVVLLAGGLVLRRRRKQ